MFEQPSQRLGTNASNLIDMPRVTGSHPREVQKAASMMDLDIASQEDKHSVKSLLSRISLPKFSLNRKKSNRSADFGSNSSNLEELPASQSSQSMAISSELQPSSARSSSSGSSTETQHPRPITTTWAKDDFSNLFTRPRPRPTPTSLPQPQSPTPTPSYATNTSEASMEEVLQTLKVLSVQYSELSRSVVKMAELHAVGVRKLEEAMAERENHVS